MISDINKKSILLSLKDSSSAPHSNLRFADQCEALFLKSLPSTSLTKIK